MALGRAERSQSRGLDQVDAEPLPAALAAARHFGGGVDKLLLDMTFVDLGAAGQAGAQGVTREETDAFRLRQVGAQGRREGTGLDEPGDVLAGQSLAGSLQPVAADRNEDRAEVDVGLRPKRTVVVAEAKGRPAIKAVEAAHSGKANLTGKLGDLEVCTQDANRLVANWSKTSVNPAGRPRQSHLGESR